MYVEAGSRSKIGKLITKLEYVRFISTGDVVTSALFNVTDARLPMFTMNLHGSCPKFSKKITGNYETSLIIDPQIYESPALIQRVLL